jgi:hypothetical protein
MIATHHRGPGRLIFLFSKSCVCVCRGNEELMEYGQIYHLWNQLELLYEWHEVLRFFGQNSGCRVWRAGLRSDYVTISDRGIPVSVRYEFTFVANHKNEKKGPRLINNTLDAVVKENIPVLLCKIKDLKVWRRHLKMCKTIVICSVVYVFGQSKIVEWITVHNE